MSNKYFRSVSSLLLAAIMLVGSIPQYSSYAESTSNHMNVVQAQSGEEMIQNLLSDEVKEEMAVYQQTNHQPLISNIKLTSYGDQTVFSAGIFTSGSAVGLSNEPILGFDNGIVISSGNAGVLNEATNKEHKYTHRWTKPGDATLSAMINNVVTNDATSLSFDIYCPEDKDSLMFEYAFASEEYNEYLDYFDAFALFVNGKNTAVIPGTDQNISVGNINHTKNEIFYRNNKKDSTIPGTTRKGTDHKFLDLPNEMDGFTTDFIAVGNLNKGAVNHIKLVVADAKDTQYDTNVFIKAKSMRFSKAAYGEINLVAWKGDTVKIGRTNGTDSAVKVTATYTDSNGKVVGDPIEVGFGNKESFKEISAPVGAVKVTISNPEFGAILGPKDTLSKVFTVNMSASPQTIVGDGISTSDLLVTVLDANSQPMAGANVELSTTKGHFIGGDSANGKVFITGVTKMDGTFQAVFKSEKISGITPVVMPLIATVTLKDGTQASQSIQMTFEPASITGVLKDRAGNPISGATVSVEKDLNNDGIIDFKQMTTTDAIGRYKITVPEGNTQYAVDIVYQKNENGKNETVKLKQIATLKEQIKGTGEELIQSNNTFTAVIKSAKKDGTGNPLSIIKDFSKVTIEDHSGGLKSARVTEEGQFTVEGLEKGKEYTLDLYYPLSSGEKIRFGSTKAKVLEDGELRLGEALVDPYGIISDEKTGKPLDGVKVEIFYADSARNKDGMGGKYPSNTSASFGAVPGFLPADNANPQTSDDKGNYAWMVHPDSDYYIVAQKSGYESFRSPVISVFKDIVRYDFSMKPIVTATGSSTSTNSGGSSGGSTGTSTGGATNSTPSPQPKETSKPTQMVSIPNNGIYNQVEKTATNDLYRLKEDTVKNATVIINDHGTFSYVPNRNFVGTDTFVIERVNGSGKVSEQTVIVEVKNPESIQLTEKTLTIHSKSDQSAYNYVSPIQVTAEYANPTGEVAKSLKLQMILPKGVEVISADGGKVVDDRIIWTIDTLKPNENGSKQVTLKKTDQSSKVEMLSVVSTIQAVADTTLKRTHISKISFKVLPSKGEVNHRPYISGYPNGDVRSDAPVTRSEVATMLVRSGNLTGLAKGDVKFKDITANGWYAPYVEMAEKTGFLNGYPDGRFKPEAFITRAEFASILANHFGMNDIENAWDKDAFNDISGNWAQNDINAVYRYKLTNGYQDGSFKPNQEITRLEACIMINKLFARDSLPKVDNSFKDMTNNHWGFGVIESAHRGYQLLIK